MAGTPYAGGTRALPMPMRNTPTLILFGAHGQLGRATLALTPPPGWRLLAFDRTNGDIGNPQHVEQALAGVEHGVVVNAAAYTAVDRAESEADQAYAVNGAAAGRLAEAAARRGLPIIHVSTDFVFDGALNEPYREEDPVNPLSVYGASKLAGEAAVIAGNPRHVILRTAWVFSPHAACFPRTIFRLLRQRDEVRVVDDQRGNPTPADSIAQAIFALAPRLSTASGGDPAFGLFHFGGAPAVSRYEFAQAIAEAAHARGLTTGRVLACATADAPVLPARRPANAVLSCARIADIHGIVPPSWRSALPACIERYEETL